jgi:hypothetical protein
MASDSQLFAVPSVNEAARTMTPISSVRGSTQTRMRSAKLGRST